MLDFIVVILDLFWSFLDKVTVRVIVIRRACFVTHIVKGEDSRFFVLCILVIDRKGRMLTTFAFPIVMA
jgi:hypothetical protein